MLVLHTHAMDISNLEHAILKFDLSPSQKRNKKGSRGRSKEKLKQSDVMLSFSINFT